MDRACGRACFSVCVCVQWELWQWAGPGSSRDVYCQQPEWDKDLNRNFKATPVSVLPGPLLTSLRSSWPCDGQQAPVQVLSVIFWLLHAFLGSCVQCGFQSVYCMCLLVWCVDVSSKSRLEDADIIGAEDLTHCSAPLNCFETGERWSNLAGLEMKQVAHRADAPKKWLLLNDTEGFSVKLIPMSSLILAQVMILWRTSSNTIWLRLRVSNDLPLISISAEKHCCVFYCRQKWLKLYFFQTFVY